MNLRFLYRLAFQKSLLIVCVSFLILALPTHFLRGQHIHRNPNWIHANGDTGILTLSVTKPTSNANKAELPPESTWNGPYRFESKNEQKHPNWTIRNYIESGFYSDGVQSGDWNYSESHSELKIDNFNGKAPEYRIETRISTNKGSWRKGVRNGSWTYEVYDNPETLKVLRERLRYGFENGWLQGMVEYELPIEQIKISGLVNQGLLEGDWFFRDSGIITEHRVYEKGILLSLSLFSKSDTQTYMYPLSKRCSDALKAKEKTADLAQYPMSLTFSDGYPKNSLWIQVQESGVQHLSQIDACIAALLPEWGRITGLSMGTNRCIYPLSPQEEGDLSQFLQRFEDHGTEVARLKDTLATFRNYDLSPFISKTKAWIQIQERRLRYTRSWKEIMESGQLVYYPRGGLLFSFAKSLLNTDTLQTENGTEYIRYSQTNNDLLAYLNRNFAQRTEAANALMDSLFEIKTRYNLTRSLLDLSSLLQERHDSIWSRCTIDSSTATPFSAYRQDFNTRYLGPPFEKQYRSFLNETDIEKEQVMGMLLLQQLDTLELIRNASAACLRLWEQADAFYMEMRVDAFTFERYNVRIKKRLFEHLETYVKNESKWHAEASFIERLASLRRLKNILQKFMYLRDVNTFSLERQLNKAKHYEIQVRLWENI